MRGAAVAGRPACDHREVAAWGDRLSVITVRTPEPDLRRADEPMGAVPGAGLPHVGHARACTRAAVPTAFATSCRMSWPSSMPRPAVARAHILRASRASSWRATCSTGGIRRAAVACAPASPTTLPGCLSWSDHYVGVTGDAACSMSRCPSYHARAPARRAGSLRLPPLGRDRERVRALPAGSATARARREPRAAADRLGRLERRHEPCGCGRTGRERLARPGSCRRHCGLRLASRGERDDTLGVDAAGERRIGTRRRRRAWLGRCVVPARIFR